MCGIGGILIYNSDASSGSYAEPLRRMGECLSRRGPDAEGTTTFEHGGLLHRRLAIMDPVPRSDQPMESRRWLLSYNGEIYNFRTLRQELSGAFNFETTSDSEVLLACLEIWGLDETLERIAGMFAFLAWDKQDGVMHAVRDHMGIKPLILGHLKDGVVFASSVSAVRTAFPDQWSEQDPDAIRSFFVLGGPFTTGTVWKGIERVPPAHVVSVDRQGRMESRRYWKPRYRPEFTMDELVDVVSEYGQSDVPAALFMSGGVDSTFLACGIPDLDCFHLTSPEQEYAEEASRLLERELVVVDPDVESYRCDFAGVLGFHGEPLMSAGIPASVSRAVAGSGYKVAISANGADELFFGYGRTPMPEYAPPYLPFHEPAGNKWFGHQFSQIFRDTRNFRVPGFGANEPSSLDLGMSMLREFHLDGFPPSASYRWFELMTYVLHDLNPTLDAASMYHSLEVRVPFLDHRIVEGVLSWDASRIVTPDHGRKTPLKTYFRDRISPAFFQRTKLGFSIHADRLGEIADDGQRSMRSWRKSGRIEVAGQSKYGDLARDLIYLGNCCTAFDAWSERQGDGFVHDPGMSVARENTGRTVQS